MHRESFLLSPQPDRFPPGGSRHAPQRPRLAARITRVWSALNAWLQTWYRLSGRAFVEESAARTIFLPAGEVFSITRASHVTRLHVRQGILWVTGSPARGDLLLREGEVHSLGTDWPYVLQAMDGPAVVTLS